MSGRGSKHRGSRSDAGTGSSGARRDVYQAPSYRMPGRTRDVVEHARQVQRDLSSMGLENKRHAEQMDQEAYTGQAPDHDHLAPGRGRTQQLHVPGGPGGPGPAQDKKAIKHSVEEFWTMWSRCPAPRESAGQYPSGCGP